MYVEDDERSRLDGELLSALAALHAPRSSRYGEICEASRNREIEFANFYVAERSRSWGPVVSYASRFSTASRVLPSPLTKRGTKKSSTNCGRTIARRRSILNNRRRCECFERVRFL